MTEQLGAQRFEQEIDQSVKKEVDKAVADAKASPELPLSEMTEEIYVQPIQKVCGGCLQFRVCNRYARDRCGAAIALARVKSSFEMP